MWVERGLFGSVIAAFDVTSFGLRLATPVQVWADLQEDCPLPTLSLFRALEGGYIERLLFNQLR